MKYRVTRLRVEMESININTALISVTELHVKQAKRFYFSSCHWYHKFMSMVLLLLKLPVSYLLMLSIRKRQLYHFNSKKNGKIKA